MTIQLAPLEGTSVDQLTQIYNTMERYVSTEQEGALQEALSKLNARPGLFARIWPTSLERENQAVTAARLRSMANASEEMFRACTNVRIEIARAQGAALVAAAEMQLQTSLGAFAAEKMLELTMTIGDSRESFLKTIRPQKAALQAYSDDPELYDPAVASLGHQIHAYFEALDELLDGFVGALKKRAAKLQA